MTGIDAMKKAVCPVARFAALVLISTLMAVTMILVSAIKIVSDISDKLLSRPDRKDMTK